MKVVLDTVLPCSPAEFHDHFVSDGAGFPMSEFHHVRGDMSITATPWAEHAGSGGGHHTNGSSTGGGNKGKGSHGHHGKQHHHGSSSGGSKGASDVSDSAIRTMRLRMPLEPHPMAPKETRVEKVQRYTQYAGPLLVVDTSARSLDIPYGDYFVTEDSWLVTSVDAPLPPQALAGSSGAQPLPSAAAIDSARAQLRQWGIPEAADAPLPGDAAGAAAAPALPGPRLCRLVAMVYVNFSKGTLLKGTISGKAESNIRAFQAEFASHALKFLVGFYASRRAIAASATAAAAPRTPAALPSPQLQTQQAQQPVLEEGAGATEAGGDVTAASTTVTAAGHRLPPAGLPQLTHPKVAALRNSAEAKLTSPTTGRPVGPSDFLSPTAALALANPSLAIAKDALMSSWLSPRKAPGASHAELVRQYTQLYASHEALVSQARRLQQGRRAAAQAQQGAGEGGEEGAAVEGEGADVSSQLQDTIMNGYQPSEAGTEWTERAGGGGEAHRLADAWAAGLLPALVFVFSLAWLPPRARALIVLLATAVLLRGNRQGRALVDHVNNSRGQKGSRTDYLTTTPPGSASASSKSFDDAADMMAEAVWSRLQRRLQHASKEDAHSTDASSWNWGLGA